MALSEKCPYSELFWSIFSCIRTEWRDTEYLFEFSPNAGKYTPKKLRIRTLLTQYGLKSKNYFHSKSRSLVLRKKFYLHYVFAISTLYLHIFTICTLDLDYNYTIFALHLHYIYTIFTLYLHYIYTPHYICSKYFD